MGEGSPVLLVVMPNQYTLFQGQAGDILRSNLHVPFEPATSLQGLYPTDILVHVHKNVCLTIFTPALSVIAKDWQQSKCPSVGWELAKSVWVHSHNGMLGSC